MVDRALKSKTPPKKTKQQQQQHFLKYKVARVLSIATQTFTRDQVHFALIA